MIGGSHYQLLSKLWYLELTKIVAHFHFEFLRDRIQTEAY